MAREQTAKRANPRANHRTRPRERQQAASAPVEWGPLHARALWFAGPCEAELRREVVAPPGPGELRARALVSGISRGTELLVYRGGVHPELPLDLPTLAGSFALPIKYGYAAVGRVLDVGAGVVDFAPGDLIFAHHPHQSRFVVPAERAVRLPRGIDPELGVFLANLETAVNVLLDTPLHLGETAVVFGQGTVGLLITQLLKLSGARRVFAVEPLPARRAAALRVGADGVFAPGEEVEERLRALTNGRGADVAIEVSGTGTGLQSAIEAVADEGTVVAVSWYGARPVTLDLGGHFHRGRVTLRASQVGQIAPALGSRWDRARRMALAVELLPRLRLSDLISHRVPFARCPEAYHLLDERPDEALQVVLTYEEE